MANFFIGNDPSRWRNSVATYDGVVYRALYPGVDMVYRGTEGQLKSEFVVSPGASPGAIELEYSGMEGMWIRGDGSLMLGTKLGELVEEAPVVYQEIGGERVAVEGRYALLGGGRVGFAVGAYDGAYPLVIDPTLVYSTYLGGSDADDGRGIAVDGSGNASVTGGTDSTDFPTQSPFQGAVAGGIRDGFVAKVAVPQIINDSLALQGGAPTTSFNPTPAPPHAPAGTFTVTGTFTNTSETRFTNVHFTVVTLTGGNVVRNADGAPPGGVGATVTPDLTAIGNFDTILDPGESITQAFDIGLATVAPFAFFIDALGVPVP